MLEKTEFKICVFWLLPHIAQNKLIIVIASFETHFMKLNKFLVSISGGTCQLEYTDNLMSQFLEIS